MNEVDYYWLMHELKQFPKPNLKAIAELLEMEDENEPFETFAKRISPKTKLYIYNKGENIPLSQKTLDEVYGDIFFVEKILKNEKPNSFIVELMHFCHYLEKDIRNMLRDSAEQIAKIGMVKCLMGEKACQFQETMNRIFHNEDLMDMFKYNGKITIFFIGGEYITAI